MKHWADGLPLVDPDWEKHGTLPVISARDITPGPPKPWTAPPCDCAACQEEGQEWWLRRT
jgi:hypothetical protein